MKQSGDQARGTELQRVLPFGVNRSIFPQWTLGGKPGPVGLKTHPELPVSLRRKWYPLPPASPPTPDSPFPSGPQASAPAGACIWRACWRKAVGLSMVTSFEPGGPDGPSCKMGTGLHTGSPLFLDPQPLGPFPPALQGPRLQNRTLTASLRLRFPSPGLIPRLSEVGFYIHLKAFHNRITGPQKGPCQVISCSLAP